MSEVLIWYLYFQEIPELFISGIPEFTVWSIDVRHQCDTSRQLCNFSAVDWRYYLVSIAKLETYLDMHLGYIQLTRVLFFRLICVFLGHHICSLLQLNIFHKMILNSMSSYWYEWIEPWVWSVCGVLWGVVILLPTLVLQSTHCLSNLAHCYFILYLHLFS